MSGDPAAARALVRDRDPTVGAPDVAPAWPNLFVVGAAKAGTTSLWWYLAQHPAIFMSSVKEPHFFSRIKPSPKLAMFFPHIEDEAEYLRLFAGAERHTVRGEASTSYLWEPAAAERIHAVAPEARIVIVLRDPVSRAHSHFLNDAAEGIEERPFPQAVESELSGGTAAWGVSSVYVSAGLYAEAVERYLALFGRDRVRVLFLEEFMVDPRAAMADLFRWLEVDADVAERLDLEPQNVFKRPRNAVARRLLGASDLRRLAWAVVPVSLHQRVRALLVRSGEKPRIDASAEALLRAYYRDDARRLSELLGRPLPWDGTGKTPNTALRP